MLRAETRDWSFGSNIRNLNRGFRIDRVSDSGAEDLSAALAM